MRIDKERLIRCIKHPIITLRLIGSKGFGFQYNKKRYLDDVFFFTFGEKINWENPEDLNQWIHWLYFNTDTSSWIDLADKFKVRNYVRDKGFGNNLVKLYGQWDKIDSFKLSQLPNSFVLKMNNGCGDIIIVKDKSKIDETAIKDYFRPMFKGVYGNDTVEDHYTKIKPYLIAEELLDKNNQEVKSSSLIDYKFWCFNGKPVICFVVLNREKGKYVVDLYDVDNDWERIEKGNMKYNLHHLRNDNRIPKPKCFDEMINVASELSKGHPQMRVDLYEVNEKVYFGELTMTSLGGRMNYFGKDILRRLGSCCRSGAVSLGLFPSK